MPRALTLALFTAGLLACNGDESSASPFLSATVDGHAWYARTSEGIVVYDVDHPDDGGYVYAISVTPQGKGERFIALNLPYPVVPGRYRVGASVAYAAYAVCPTAVGEPDCQIWGAIPDDAGTLEITSVDSTTGMVEGALSFTGYLGNTPEGSKASIARGRFALHVNALGLPPG